MKNLRYSLALTVALLGSAALASALPGRAEVKKVVGNATVAKAAGGSASITTGMVLGAGDTVNTGAGSTVDLDLGLNGDFVRVDPDSSLKIATLDIANVANRTVTTELAIAKGTVVGNVMTKLTAASKYEIKTASGVAGIRGTKYQIVTDITGRVLSVTVTSGSVTFMDRGVLVTIDASSGGKKYTPPATPPTAATAAAAVANATVAETAAVNNAATNITGVGGDRVGFAADATTTTTTVENPNTTSKTVVTLQ